MHALEAREAGFKALPADISEMRALRLHPGLTEPYAGKVARPEDALNDHVDGCQAAEIIGGMIDRITLTPAEDGLAAGMPSAPVPVSAIAPRFSRKSAMPLTNSVKPICENRASRWVKGGIYPPPLDDAEAADPPRRLPGNRVTTLRRLVYALRMNRGRARTRIRRSPSWWFR